MNFLSLLFVHLFWLWNVIDFAFWMTTGFVVDMICELTTNTLFWFIERIIEPNITVDQVFNVLFWFISPPLLIMNLLLAILPIFSNYKNNYQSIIFRAPKCCSSGRHSNRGRHVNRNHVWWHGQLDHSPYNNKERTYSPRKRTRVRRGLLRQQEKHLRLLIEGTDYYNVTIMPPTMYIHHDDVYYDVQDQPPDWIPSDHSIPSPINATTIASLVDSIDVLSYYQALKAIENISFFNSQYTLLNPSSQHYSRILIQARHLKSQVFHYDTTLDICTDTTTAIYVSSRDDEPPVVIDTGASGSITPLGSDFEDGIIHQADLQELKQVNGSTPVCGQGTVNWHIEDVEGTQRLLRTEAYYVPDAGIRLFSPQVYIGNNKTARLLIDHTGILFTMKCGTVMRFPFNKSNNLPFMLTKSSLQSRRSSHLLSYVNTLSSKSVHNNNSLIDRSVFNRDNFNLNPAQLELLKWHCRWCHCDLKRVRMILSKPQQLKGSVERGEITPHMVVPTKTGTTTCAVCICTACQYAKQKRTTPDSSIEVKNEDLEGVLTAGDLHPGDKVSCDQYMSPSKGRLQHTRGAESSSNQYVGGTIFIDHATNYLFNNHQVNLTAVSTIESKHSCESKFDEFGVQIKQFHADNHPFRSKVWAADCTVQQQLPTSHSGVGAHHQVLAERQIQTTFNWSRANLLHFVLHWPQMAKSCENLWPYAVDYAVYMHNHLPIRDMRLSPVEKFTGTMFSNYNHLTRAHTFGCPVYVLDPRLQDSKTIPKWKMRSRRGIYLGVSKYHSSTVHLVLNPETGAISPQYHCVFDDTFSTVWSDGVFDYNVWECLVKTVDRHHSVEPNQNGQVTLPPDFTPFSDDINETSIHHENQHRSHAPSIPVNNNNNNNINNNNDNNNNNNNLAPSSQDVISTESESPLLSRRIFHPPSSPSPSSPIPARTPSETQEQPRRSTRSNFGHSPDVFDPSSHHITNNITLSEHYCHTLGIKLPSASRGRTNSQGGPSKTSYTSERQNLPKVQRSQLNSHYLACIDWAKFINVLSTGITTLDAFTCELRKNITYENGIKLLEYFNPALLITVINQEDNPTLKEAMNGPDASGFMKAMETEIETLIKMQAFVVVDKQPWMNVVSSVWAFRRKRYPDGTIRKLKARICARGFEQIEGIDYFETFAPVVQWMTVRIVLIMTILLHLENKQIDYTAAFLQAPIDHDVYVEMPKLFNVKGKVWKLQRAIYGLKDAPRAYFLHTKNKLEELGFRQSDADPCLFISPTVICLIYVDDALFVYKSPEEVDILTKRMKAIGMLFEEESDVAGYLGVLIDRDPDNDTITLRQSGLAQRIVEALHLDDNTTPVKTPAEAFLPLDEDGERAHEIYNYASVAGMLQYLQGHSRPDISFAVSQISRYTFGPKRSHEVALERIGRYLKGTIDGGLLLKPNLNESTFKIDVYVDAAFASGWGTEQGTNPDSVKSRTGYIIEVMGCAVVWCSKLQPCIATSTMESEYTALSMSLRAAIPLIEITKAINKGLKFTTTKLLTFKATVHEDNMGALKLAKLEPGRNTPRSKFYALKLHWFRSWLVPREIEIIHCATKDQKADYLTKPLGPTMFVACRKLSMGW